MEENSDTVRRVWLTQPEEGVLFHCILPHPLRGRLLTTVVLDLLHCVWVRLVLGVSLEVMLFPPFTAKSLSVGPSG
jgi:hypothetical protein